MSNFKDPVGLFKRMLLSGDRTARFTLFRELLHLGLIPADAALSLLERRRPAAATRPRGGRRWTDQVPAAACPAVLVVGGPRSGTTLVSQALAAALPVSYLTNLMAAFPRSPMTAARLFHRRPARRFDFTNYFGSVAGLDGPNDGFALWNRWFGDARGRVEPLDDAAAADLRGFLDRWWATTGRPFLNKNNRNALAIAALHEAVPEALFVEVHREPVHVAQSLIHARAAVQGEKHRGWGLLAEDSDPADPMGHVDAVCRQVEAFRAAIDAGRAAVPAHRYVRVGYEDFCREPGALLEEVRSRLWPDAADRPAFLRGVRPFRSTNRQRVGDEELARITRFFEGSAADPRVRPVCHHASSGD